MSAWTHCILPIVINKPAASFAVLACICCHECCSYSSQRTNETVIFEMFCTNVRRALKPILKIMVIVIKKDILQDIVD